MFGDIAATLQDEGQRIKAGRKDPRLEIMSLTCWINLLYQRLLPEFLAFLSFMSCIAQDYFNRGPFACNSKFPAYNSLPHLCKHLQHCP